MSETRLRPLRRNSVRKDEPGTAGGLQINDRGPRPLRPDQDLVHNPKLAKVAGPFGRISSRPLFAERARARDCRLCHHPATGVGLSDGRARTAGESSRAAARKVEAILGGMRPHSTTAREQIVYEMATVLSSGRWVSRGLHERAVRRSATSESPT